MSADVSVGPDIDAERNQLRQICRAGEIGGIKEIEHQIFKSIINSRDPNTGYTALHSAAIFNRYDVLQLLLQNGAEVNVGGIKDEQTALHKVARYVGANEQIKCAQLLLEHGADINYQDKQGNTVLHLAVATENVKLMQYLLSKNPDMTLTNHTGKTARELATTAIDVFLSDTRTGRYTDVLDLLDNAISDSDRESMLAVLHNLPLTEYNPELLKRAIALDNYEAAEILLENGLKVNDVDDQKNPILMILTQIPPEKRLKYFELLLKYGANVNEVDADGCHFFQHLITELRESPTEDILKFTIHVLQVRNRQPTATIFMMHKDAFGKALFSYLWRLPGFAGYTIRTQFEFGRQLLDWRESTSDEEKSLLTTRGVHGMVTNNELELLRDTINKFPGSVNSRNWKSQSTSFHLAADAGRPEIIRDLINARAELDCRDCFQSTALIRCFVPFEQSVSHKFDLTTPRKVRKHSPPHYQCANMLLDAGANVTLGDDTLNTALHYAVLTLITDANQNNYFNSINMVQRLLQMGETEKATKNRQNQTPLDIAKSCTFPDANLISYLS